MAGQRDHEQAVGLLYDATYTQSAEAWSAAAQALMRVSGATGCVLQIADMQAGRSHLLASPGCESLNMASYAEHYVRHDLWAQKATPEHHDKAILLHQLVAPNVWERSEIYNDFVRPGRDFFWCLGAALPMRDGQVGLLGLLRERGAAHFGAAEAADLDALLPHLKRSLQLTHHLQRLELDLGFARGALDAFSFGIVVCDARGKVLVTNRLADDILHRRDGLVFNGHHTLEVADPRLCDRLHRLIAAAGGRSSADASSAGGAIRIDRSGRPALKLLVAPLPEAQAAALGAAGGAMILIDDPERNAAPALEALKALFGLTGAEARLVRRLAQGDRTAPEIAAEFALSPQTIRTQMKSIHRKMDVSHQAEISAIVSRLGLLGS